MHDANPIAGLIILIVGLVVYFLPTMIAIKRRMRRQAGVGVLNTFLGWTFLGWVGALVWAVSGDKEDDAGTRR
ncbi:MAG: superinfection immunity protein [Pseudomonadota bacterium]